MMDALWFRIIVLGLVVLTVCYVALRLLGPKILARQQERFRQLPGMTAARLYAEKAAAERWYPAAGVWVHPRWRPYKLLEAATNPEYPQRRQALDYLGQYFTEHQGIRMSRRAEKSLLELAKDVAISDWVIRVVDDYGKESLSRKARVLREEARSSAVEALPRLGFSELEQAFLSAEQAGSILTLDGEQIRTHSELVQWKERAVPGTIRGICVIREGIRTEVGFILQSD